MARAAERPDDLDVVPAPPAHPISSRALDLAALNLIVEHPILAVWIPFAVGVGNDDAIPVGAHLRDFPRCGPASSARPIANQMIVSDRRLPYPPP